MLYPHCPGRDTPASHCLWNLCPSPCGTHWARGFQSWDVDRDFNLSFSKTVSQESETVPHNDPNNPHSQHFLSRCYSFQAGCVYNSNPHSGVQFLLHPDSEMTASNGDLVSNLNLPCHYPIPQ